MGTTPERRRKDGAMVYRVGSSIKENGGVVHNEAGAFDDSGPQRTKPPLPHGPAAVDPFTSRLKPAALAGRLLAVAVMFGIKRVPDQSECYKTFTWQRR